MRFGLTFLRWLVGGLFIGHGTQKLFGWFGGHGLDATGQAFESMGLRPGRKHAAAAGATETAGGALTALGLFTPAAAAMLIGVMSTAIRKVHLKNGLWVTEGGYEYPLVLSAILLALADLGPGEFSLDRALGTEVKGPVVALVALVGGLAGGAIVTEFAPWPETDATDVSMQAAPESAPEGSEPVSSTA